MPGVVRAERACRVQGPVGIVEQLAGEGNHVSLAFGDRGFEQITTPTSRFRSFPAYMPLGSLDKAYCRGGVEVRNARVVRSKLAKQASDHLPLVVDFHLGDASIDHMIDMTEADRRRVFQLGYYTWVEQQGTPFELFEQRRSQ